MELEFKDDLDYNQKLEQENASLLEEEGQTLSELEEEESQRK